METTSATPGGNKDSAIHAPSEDSTIGIAATPRAEVDPAWAALWDSISNGKDVSADDEDALFACARWRRKREERRARANDRSGQPGERSHFWSRLSAGLHYFSQAGMSTSGPDRLTFIIRTVGVPSKLRGAVWYACSSAALKRHAAPHSYGDLVAAGMRLDNDAVYQIEKDLPRTGVPTVSTHPLRRVLLAFAARNPEIGYCQSMNFITAALLQYCDEEHAFWVLCSLIEDILPQDYYTVRMTGLRADMQVLDLLVARFLPKLHQHFTKLGVDLSLVSMNWFLCLFTNTFPVDQSHRVLDCLLHEGPLVLFRAALGLLIFQAMSLLQCSTPIDVYMLLRAPLGALDEPEQDDSPTSEPSARRPCPEPLLSPTQLPNPAANQQRHWPRVRLKTHAYDLFDHMYGRWLRGRLSATYVEGRRSEFAQAACLADRDHAARKKAWKERREADEAKSAVTASAGATQRAAPSSAADFLAGPCVGKDDAVECGRADAVATTVDSSSSATARAQLSSEEATFPSPPTSPEPCAMEPSNNPEASNRQAVEIPAPPILLDELDLLLARWPSPEAETPSTPSHGSKRGQAIYALHGGNVRRINDPVPSITDFVQRTKSAPLLAPSWQSPRTDHWLSQVTGRAVDFDSLDISEEDERFEEGWADLEEESGEAEYLLRERGMTWEYEDDPHEPNHNSTLLPDTALELRMRALTWADSRGDAIIEVAADPSESSSSVSPATAPHSAPVTPMIVSTAATPRAFQDVPWSNPHQLSS